MIVSALLTAALLVLAQATDSSASDTALDEVKQLYASAAYQDALTRLSALDGRDDPNQLDQYRALCLVGLGRTADAEQVIERIVLRAPLFQVGEGEASPAFLAKFAAVRKRVLPLAANKLYARAKTSFDLKDYAAAAAQLQELLVISKLESSSGNSELTNLHQLAQGFLRLTEAQVAAESRTIYTALDREVTPPVELERRIPAWNPPAQYAWRWFRGVVQVVVDEQGNVESAQLVQSMADFYDTSLLEAARRWRFEPALRGGQPVKYRKIVEITMRPQ
jgi:TonB family protein